MTEEQMLREDRDFNDWLQMIEDRDLDRLREWVEYMERGRG